MLFSMIVEAVLGILSMNTASNIPNKRSSLPAISVKAIVRSKNLDNDREYSDVIIVWLKELLAVWTQNYLMSGFIGLM